MCVITRMLSTILPGNGFVPFGILVAAIVGRRFEHFGAKFESNLFA